MLSPDVLLVMLILCFLGLTGWLRLIRARACSRVMLLAGAGTVAGAMSRGPECGGGEGDCHRGCLIVRLRARRRVVGRRLSAGVLGSAAGAFACAGTAAGVTVVVDDGGGAGVDRVHSTCASICVDLCAGSKRDFNAIQKVTTQVPKPLSGDFTMQELSRT